MECKLPRAVCAGADDQTPPKAAQALVGLLTDSQCSR
jgi:hypothetical protein